MAPPRRRTGLCHNCHQHTDELTRDHIVPISRAGMRERFNIVMCCRPCNTAKANNWPTCTCPKCVAAVRAHWAMIESVEEWSYHWAAQLRAAAEKGREITTVDIPIYADNSLARRALVAGSRAARRAAG